jgi:chemotaxis protein methyltransferase CheR
MNLMLTDEEIDVLLRDIHEIYGYDFNEYAKASLKRRINRLFTLDRFPSFAEFRFRIKTNTDYFTRFIEQITVNVTEMFRDPDFYLALRKEVLPILSTYPFIRIWHAGCSTGEEVYSMAILLKETNLLHKSILYATDINPKVVQRAASGIFQLSHMKQYSENYIQSGGIQDFSAYYTAGNNKVIFDQAFKKHMVFSTHNLAAESSFNEFQLIVCRNVLIYFDRDLQAKVFNLFNDSLERLGFIALGSKESLRLPPGNTIFKEVATEKIWRKMT